MSGNKWRARVTAWIGGARRMIETLLEIAATIDVFLWVNWLENRL
jgi:hypothetical protein